MWQYHREQLISFLTQKNLFLIEDNQNDGNIKLYVGGVNDKEWIKKYGLVTGVGSVECMYKWLLRDLKSMLETV